MSSDSHNLHVGRGVLATLMIAALAGCATGEAQGVEDVVELPEAFKRAVPVEGPALDRWCSDFGAPQLERMVNLTFTENLDLMAAWARLEQAEAVARQAGAALWPVVEASGQASIGSRALPTPQGLETFSQEQFQASVAAGWEIDIWGKLRKQREAAVLDALALRADAQGLALSLTSEVAEAYFDVVYQQQRAELFTEQLETSRRYLELTRLRLAQGQASALDVTQQRQQIQGLEAQLRLIVNQEELAEQRLAVLLGEPPQQEVSVAAEELPEVPPLPAAGVPADLLERRPDLRAARIRLEAADARIAVAVRDQLPSLRLSASLFVQAPSLAELLDALLYQLAAEISQPIFDGGRRDAVIDAARAQRRALLYTYGQALLLALQEVERAMVSEATQVDFIELLEQQRQTAVTTLELARERYRRGGDYLRVLTALQTLQQVEQSILDARRQRLSFRVQTCRALGGGWTRAIEPPAQGAADEPAPQQEEAAPDTTTDAEGR